jgi:hypothetical protein
MQEKEWPNLMQTACTTDMHHSISDYEGYKAIVSRYNMRGCRSGSFRGCGMSTNWRGSGHRLVEADVLYQWLQAETQAIATGPTVNNSYPVWPFWGQESGGTQQLGVVKLRAPPMDVAWSLPNMPLPLSKRPIWERCPGLRSSLQRMLGDTWPLVILRLRKKVQARGHRLQQPLRSQPLGDVGLAACRSAGSFVRENEYCIKRPYLSSMYYSNQ